MGIAVPAFMANTEPGAGLKRQKTGKAVERSRTAMLLIDWFKEPNAPILLPGFNGINILGNIDDNYLLKM
jgi:hypothetical protein